MLRLLTLFCVSCHLALSAINVEIDSPHCALNKYTLKCDFGFTPEDVIFDSQNPKLLRNDVRIVEILNVNSLHIPRVVCSDVHFRDIKNIEFKSSEECKSNEVSLYFHNSVVNYVPRKVKRLDFVDSEVGSVSCDLGLQRILISKSKVLELNSPWPVAGNQHMQIHNSYVKKIKALNLQGSLLLHITNTTIDSIEKEAIILGKHVTAILTACDIKSGNNGLVVKTGGRVLLQNTVGKFSVIGPASENDHNYDKTAPGVPSKVAIAAEESDETKEGQPKCRQPSYWYWLIPTVVASFEAIILIKMCSDRISTKKKKLENDPEETTWGNKPNLSPNSTLGYYNESFNFNPNINRRKQI